jgi:uncharacterized phage protein gp47/JayE
VAEYGVTDLGFAIKPLEVIKAEMEADLKANISSGINLETVSPNGQLLGTIAGQVSKAWEMGEDVYHAGQTSASGYSLDSVAALTGTLRSPGLPSTGTVTVNLEAGASVPADSRIAVEDNPTAVFRLLTAVENTGGSAADFDVEVYSDEYGPILGNAGTLTVILDPVVGWNTVTNAEDMTLGQLRQSDADLRESRVEELARGGNSTVDSIRTDVLDVAGVTAVQVRENTTDATVDSIPAGFIEVIVTGGEEQDIGDAIWDSVGAATGTYGSETVIVRDAQGVYHTVYFTRPTEVEIWLDVTITGANPISFVGEGAVKAALIAYQESRPSGTDVVRNRLEAVVFGLGGVSDSNDADVTVLLSTTNPAAGTSNIVIGTREIADLDTARIIVNVSL